MLYRRLIGFRSLFNMMRMRVLTWRFDCLFIKHIASHPIFFLLLRNLQIKDRLELPLFQWSINLIACNLEHLNLINHVKHLLFLGKLVVQKTLVRIHGVSKTFAFNYDWLGSITARCTGNGAAFFVSKYWFALLVGVLLVANVMLERLALIWASSRRISIHRHTATIII